MGKITRALIKYNRTPDTHQRSMYHRFDSKEDRLQEDHEEDHSEPSSNMLSAIVVVLVVTALSMLSLHTIFYIHKGQKENARLTQSFLMQQSQIEQLSIALGDREASKQWLDKAKHTQLAMAQREAEWQEFARDRHQYEIQLAHLAEDQNVMLEKLMQMSSALNDMGKNLLKMEGKQ